MSTNQTTQVTYDGLALLAGFGGVITSLVLATIGAGIGSHKSFKGIAHLSLSKPTLIIKCMIPIVMAGIIAIYGLIVSVILAKNGNYLN